MTLRLKAIVAAVALVAVAAAPAANAAMTTSGSGDSSLVLTLLDNTAGISATFDLGFNYSTISNLVSQATTNGGTFTWDLTTGNYGAAWSTYFATATAANTKWAAFAGDNLGSGAGSRGMIMTQKTTAPGSNLTTTIGLTTSLANFDQFIAGNNFPSATSNHNQVDDGAGTAKSGQAFAGNAVGYGSTGRVNASGFNSMQGLDTSMNLLQLLSGDAATKPITTTYLGNVLGKYSLSLSSTGKLTFTVPVAPVPEADSYAMIVAGLGLVGFAARRRNAK